MKKIVLLFLFLVYNLSAQEYLAPIKAISFGLNNHTNRDISFYTNTDSSGNILNIGTTERDSTLTDLITTKLDPNLNLIWQKRFSIDNNLSYDVPLDSYIDSNDNLLVIGRSSHHESFINGLLFIVKYDKDGNQLWNTTIGNTDGSDYYDYAYYNSYFQNDILRITYIPYLHEESIGNKQSEIKYLKIDSIGNITEEYNSYAANDGIKSTYKDGIHYTLVRKENEVDFSYNYYLRKIGVDIDENYTLNNQDNFVQDHFTTSMIRFRLEVDNSQNVYIIKPKDEGLPFELSITKINNTGDIVYSKNTSPNDNLLGSYIDSDDRLCLIYEDSSVGKLFNKKLDDTGNDYELTSVDYANFSGSKLNPDQTLFVVNSSDEISLLNKDLSYINSFNYSRGFPISDITIINNSEIVVSGTSYEKMYESSDFYSQNNIVLERLNQTQILNTYSFSGEGTSKAFQQKLVIDNENNYIVFSQEKLGPDNWQIGGSRAPLHKNIKKYDGELNLIWTYTSDNILISDSNIIIDSNNNIFINSETPESNIDTKSFELLKIDSEGKLIFNVPSFQNRNIYLDQNNNINIVSPPTRNNTTYDDDTSIYTFNSNSGELLNTKVLEGLEFLKQYNSENGNSYLYMYTGSNTSGDTSPKMNIYKNLDLNFSVDLVITGTYAGINIFELSKNGDLFFGSSWGQNNAKLHKISLSNSYSYIDLDDRLSGLKILENGKVFTIVDLISNNEGQIKIYNNDLTEYSSNSEIIYNYSKILELNGLVLLNSHYNNLVKVYDINSVKVDEFKIVSNFGYAEVDSNGDVILTGNFGNQVYTYNEYSWTRGLLHKYEYKKTSDFVDNDNDGIIDSIDLCLNSAYPNLVDEFGCFQLPSNNFTIQTKGETCKDQNNAKIIIKATEALDYIVTLDGNEYKFTNDLTIENLTPGDYEICIKVPADSYEQCYNISLEQGVTISGKSSVNLGILTCTLFEGTPPFNISKNGIPALTTLATSFNLKVKHGDVIEVTSEKECEGKLTKVVEMTDSVMVSPNPTKGEFEIAIPGYQKQVFVEVYSIHSQLLNSNRYNIQNGKIKLNTSNQPRGVYFVKIYLDEGNQVGVKVVKD